MSKIIMIVTNQYDPDVRVHKEAVYLVSKGFEVEVLCWDREGHYKNKEVEEVDNVYIRRFFPFSRYGSGINQLLPYVRFMRMVKKHLSTIEYKYIHCHDLDGVIVGKYAKNQQATLVFDMHEIYELRTSSSVKRNLIKKLVSYYINASDHIVYLNELQRIVSRKKQDNWVYLPNYPEKKLMGNITKMKSSQLRLSYIGSVRQFDVFKNLFEASKGLDNLSIYIHGGGVHYKKVKELAEKYDNIIVTGPFEMGELPKFYQQTDIAYIVYSEDNSQHMQSYPVKFYEAIMTNTPIIVNKRSKLEKVIIDKDIGFTVDPNKVGEIRELLKELIIHPEELEKKEQNLFSISNKYVWENVVKNLDKIYS